MRILRIGLLTALLVGCQTGGIYSGGDGSSLEHAVVIKAAHESNGIRAEYQWLHQHYPGYQRGAQHLLSANGRAYDQLDIVTADGQQRSVFFDITSFLGK